MPDAYDQLLSGFTTQHEPQTDPYDTLLDKFKSTPKKSDFNLDESINRHAKRTGLDPNLVKALVHQESGGNARALSPKGALGVMQLMPATAARFGVRDRNNPEENIKGGTDYLRWLSDRYQGDVDKILAGYNAGEGAVDKHNGIPPYKETRNYVKAIKSKIGDPYDQLLAGFTGAAQSNTGIGQDAIVNRESGQLLSTSSRGSTEQTAVSNPFSRKSSNPSIPKPTVPLRPRAPGVTLGDLSWHLGLSPQEIPLLTPQQRTQAYAIARKGVAGDELKKAQGVQLQPSLDYINSNRTTLGLKPKSMLSVGLPEASPTQTDQGRSPFDLTPAIRQGIDQTSKTKAVPLKKGLKQLEDEHEISTRQREADSLPFGLRILPQELNRFAAKAERAIAGLADYAEMLPHPGRGDGPNLTSEISDYLKRRAHIAETIGNYESEDVKASLPKTAVKAVADAGMDLASLIAITRATGLPFPTVMAGEAALNSSDKPASDIAKETAKAYALGRAYEYLPGKIAEKLNITSQVGTRSLGAGLFGTTGAAQTAYEGGDKRQVLSQGIAQGALGTLGGPHKKAAKVTPVETRRPEESRQQQAQEATNKLLELGVIDHKAAYEAVKKAAVKPEDLTSLRRVDINEDRKALGLPEFNPPEKKSWESTFEAARAKGYDKNASRIASEVLREEGKTLSDEQAAGIATRLAQLKNEHKIALNEGNGDRVETIEQEFNQLHEASNKAGTETARALNLRKATLNDDYELITLVQRAKAKGIEITPAKRAEYSELSARIKDLEGQLAKANEKADLAGIQNKLDTLSRFKARAETKVKLDTEFASLKSDFAIEFKRISGGNTQAAGLAGIDPEGKLTILIGKMVHNRAKSGINNATDLIDSIHSDLKGFGISRDDVRAEVERSLQTSPRDKAAQTRLLNQEAELTRRLTEKDFSKPTKNEIIYTPETLKLKVRVDKLKAQYETELHNASLTKPEKWKQYAFDAAMIPKSVMSSADLSAPLRQGLFHTVTHPIISAKAFATSLTAINDLGHAKLKQAIENHPDFTKAQRAGVEFTGLDKPNVREEHYISNFTKNLPIIKHSERAFTGFLDTQRLQVFSKLSEGVKDPMALKAIAKMINIASGRADVKPGGALDKSMYAANLALYSPRLVASRFQLLNKMLNPVAMKNMPAEVRGRLIADNVKFIAGVSTVLGLAASAGVPVSLDPDDSEFLKMKVGNTRYDILGGLQQPLRATLRMMKAISNYAQDRKDSDTAGDIAGRFVRSKLSPEASFLTDLFNERDYLGKPFTVKKGITDRLQPLVVKDFYEAMQEEGLIGAAKTTPAFFGVGVQTYPDKKKKTRGKLRF